MTRKKSDRNRLIDIYCTKCGSHIYRYLKEGGERLVKCYVENIMRDYTKVPMHCPGCDEEFAGETIYHNRLAYKIIQGKVFVRG